MINCFKLLSNYYTFNCNSVCVVLHHLSQVRKKEGCDRRGTNIKYNFFMEMKYSWRLRLDFISSLLRFVWDKLGLKALLLFRLVRDKLGLKALLLLLTIKIVLFSFDSLLWRRCRHEVFLLFEYFSGDICHSNSNKDWSPIIILIYLQI